MKAMDVGSVPTLMAVPAVSVDSVIGVTELDPVLAT